MPKGQRGVARGNETPRGNPYAPLGGAKGIGRDPDPLRGKGTGKGGKGASRDDDDNDRQGGKGAKGAASAGKKGTSGSNNATNNNAPTQPACVDYARGRCHRPACAYRHVPPCSTARCTGDCGRVHLRGPTASQPRGGIVYRGPLGGNSANTAINSNTASKGSYLDALRRHDTPQPAAEAPALLHFEGYTVRAPERATYSCYAESKGVMAAGIWEARFAAWRADAIAAEQRIWLQHWEELGALHARWVEEQPGRKDEALPCPECGLLLPSAAVHAAHMTRHREEAAAATRKKHAAAQVQAGNGWLKRWKAEAAVCSAEEAEAREDLCAAFAASAAAVKKAEEEARKVPAIGQKVWAIRDLLDEDGMPAVDKGEEGEVIGLPEVGSKYVADVRFGSVCFEATAGMVVGEGIHPLPTPDTTEPPPNNPPEPSTDPSPNTQQQHSSLAQSPVLPPNSTPQQEQHQQQLPPPDPSSGTDKDRKGTKAEGGRDRDKEKAEKG